MADYPTERLQCFKKAKELRFRIYRDFVTAHEKGELICGGSGASHFSVPQGLGKVHFLAGESYGANIAANKAFVTEAMEEFEKAGYARDLCSYLRNYIGAVMLDKYLDAEGKVHSPFPHIDFFFTYHICDDHTRWYRIVSELQGGTAPVFGYDQTPGYQLTNMVTPWGTEYLYEQMAEGVEWMEKVTGRKWDEEKFSEAFRNEARTSKAYAEAMECNQNIPAPMDEKMIFVFLGLTSMAPFDKEVADFMEEFRDEIRDRAARGIAAVPNERFRVMTDSNPPWQGLQIYRHIEKEYGVATIGSVYSMGLHAAYEYNDQGELVPAPVPHDIGVPMRNREELLRAHIDWKGKLMTGFEVFNTIEHEEIIKKILKKWKADAMMIHLNRGCVGNTSQKLVRLALLDANIPVCVYEGNVGDYREFDYERALEKIESFFDGVIGKLGKE